MVHTNELMSFNTPLSSEKANRLIRLLNPNPGSRILDVGCGTGEFLVRVAEKYHVTCEGIDINYQSIENARQRVKERNLYGSVKFSETDIKNLEDESSQFDCGVCLASTHAFATGEPAYPEALKWFSKSVKSGGKVLIGESFWGRDPCKEYLDFVGTPVGTYRTHLKNVELGIEFGLRPLYVTTSSLDEWDDFEWRHNMTKEASFRNSNKGAEDTEEIESSRQWKLNYLKWGRGTMGFGYYLFEKP